MKPKSTAFGEISTRTSHGSWSFSRAATRRSSWRSIRRWFIRLTSPNQSQSKSTVSVSLRSASVSAARPCASASATQFSEHSEISCPCFSRAFISICFSISCASFSITLALNMWSYFTFVVYVKFFRMSIVYVKYFLKIFTCDFPSL